MGLIGFCFLVVFSCAWCFGVFALGLVFLWFCVADDCCCYGRYEWLVGLFMLVGVCCGWVADL